MIKKESKARAIGRKEWIEFNNKWNENDHDDDKEMNGKKNWKL